MPPKMMMTEKMPISEGSKHMVGMVKRTGMYKLHKGEVVLPKLRVKSVDKALKADGKKPLKK
jgi:hypothetical protein